MPGLILIQTVIFMKEFFDKVDFEKNQMTKKYAKLSRGQRFNVSVS